MSAMFEGGYRIKDSKIQKLFEGSSYYDVDWGNCKEPNYWLDICDDTPKNRAKYGL